MRQEKPASKKWYFRLGRTARPVRKTTGVVRGIPVKTAVQWDPGAETEQGLGSKGKPVWLNYRVEKAGLYSRRQVSTQASGAEGVHEHPSPCTRGWSSSRCNRKLLKFLRLAGGGGTASVAFSRLHVMN